MNATAVIVYSKPLCVQCDATKRALAKADIAYDVVDITEDADALANDQGTGLLAGPRGCRRRRTTGPGFAPTASRP